MRKKIFFYKKKRYKKYYFFLLFIFILIIGFTFYTQNTHNFFIINKNIKEFYIIPSDKGGKTIPNQDIKILDYDSNANKKIEKNYINKQFSIQLYSSSDYNSILEKYDHFAKKLLFLEDDLFIVAIKFDLGIDYLLVYKNFNNRKEAFDYCDKYLNIIRNCLIVNFQNLE